MPKREPQTMSGVMSKKADSFHSFDTHQTPRSVLTRDQLAHARGLYDRVGHLTTCKTRQQWAGDFSLDMHPHNELILWSVIAEAYEKVSQEFPELSEQDKAAAISSLVSHFVDVSEIRKVPQKFVDRVHQLLTI